jgi:hypothetical protein
MEGFVETFESLLDYRFPEPDRTWMLDNDPTALGCSMEIRPRGRTDLPGLTKWRVRCMIYAGAGDTDIHGNAAKAAAEIPGALFLSLAADPTSPPRTRSTSSCPTSSIFSTPGRTSAEAKELQPAAMAATPASARISPTIWRPDRRSPRTVLARTTVMPGYSEVSTATMEIRPARIPSR